MNTENLGPGYYWWERDYGPLDDGSPSYALDGSGTANSATLVRLYYVHSPTGSYLAAGFHNGNVYRAEDLTGRLRGPIKIPNARDAPIVAEEPHPPRRAGSDDQEEDDG